MTTEKRCKKVVEEAEKHSLLFDFENEKPPSPWPKKRFVVTYKMYTFMTAQLGAYAFAYVCFFRLMPWTYSVFLNFLFEKLEHTEGFELHAEDLELPLLERNLSRRVLAIIYYAEKMILDHNSSMDEIYDLFVVYLSDVIHFDVDGPVFYNILKTHQTFLRMKPNDLSERWFEHKRLDTEVSSELITSTEAEYERIFRTIK